jgi:hypothetical protein
MAIQRITSGIIADGAIVATDIGDGVVTASKIADANVTSSKLASTLSISGNFLANNITANTNIVANTGSAAAPSIFPTGDTNTGIFFPAADTIAFAEGGVEAMRIDSGGRVTMPYQTLAVVGRETSAWTTNNTIVWNKVNENIGNAYNASTGEFTCPVTGYYMVSIFVMSDSQSTMDVELQKNGSTALQFVPFQSDTGGLHNQISGMTIISCAANDTLRLKLTTGSIYPGNQGKHGGVVFKLIG